MDLKAFLTNRVLAALYCCYLFSALAKQRIAVGTITPGLVCTVSLQMIYWLRRTWNDPCRPSSLDNQTDKAGFCRIWGALVFLPTLYLTPVTLLAQTAKSPNLFTACVLFVFGLVFQLWTGIIDEQRREFRDCEGQMKVDGKDPFYINAKYRKEGGEAAVNILLGSGYWGRARHFNYATEVLSFLFWTLPTRIDFFVAYLPVLFLAAFLWFRANRDEFRCLMKYQHHWIQYTNKVRYQFLPSIY
uniref:7-dehydrocholesterol reductase n=1 Tax=Bursaphelenchus xylophilus TaxID=6326 RepID=A0A1I7RX35_BURXY